ncbi:YdcF family protein [Hymenobacter monticola]|uniref:YdcF family protein n=1 Tax=Hymenobacter monticola TaxID=1705399 RepID=A0ABY4B7G3_9BACT|nr:YdcF family protein [Hymenobacter monticola]UOE33703.1 YdcF family protein [Hymenobacter monticola]
MRYLNGAKALLGLFLLWFFGHTAFTVVDGLTDQQKKADLAVILGNKVNEDGTLSARLESRLRCGLALYRRGRVRRLLVSGGLGREGYLEGQKMKAYLLAHAVPDSLIVVDNHGDNTQATVANTLRLRDSLHFRSLLIVSQYYHLTRTKMLFRKQHFNAISSASPRYFEARDAYSLIREFFAYYSE